LVRQFAYVHGVARISLLSGKKYKCSSTIFFSLLKTTTTNPNHQNCAFFILHTGFTVGYKTGQKFFNIIWVRLSYQPN